MSARDVVRREGGSWHGSYGMIRCPVHDDRTPSCKVSDAAAKSGDVDVHCFAGCDWRDVKAELGVDGADLMPRSGARYERNAGNEQSPAEVGVKPRDDEHDRIEQALEVWRNAGPINGTPADAYLRSRGLDPARMLTDPPGWPETLRWSADISALVVAVNHRDNGLVRAVHRIYLHPDGSPVVRDGKKLKLSLAPIGGHAAHLSCWPGPDGSWGIAEGVETALAARQLFKVPVWAGISSGNIPNVRLPSWARHITIFADHDDSGAGLRAASKALHQWRALPRVESVRVLMADALGADVADVLEEARHA